MKLASIIFIALEFALGPSAVLSSSNYCGATWNDAASCNSITCPNGADSECPAEGHILANHGMFETLISRLKMLVCGLMSITLVLINLKSCSKCNFRNCEPFDNFMLCFDGVIP